MTVNWAILATLKLKLISIIMKKMVWESRQVRFSSTNQPFLMLLYREFGSYTELGCDRSLMHVKRTLFLPALNTDWASDEDTDSFFIIVQGKGLRICFLNAQGTKEEWVTTNTVTLGFLLLAQKLMLCDRKVQICYKFMLLIQI